MWSKIRFVAALVAFLGRSSDALNVASIQQPLADHVLSDEDLTKLWDGEDMDEDLTKLWDGEDMDESVLTSFANRSESSALAKPVAVLGMFDSGTNVMDQTLRLNFGQSIGHPANWPFNHIDAIQRQLWKHSPPVLYGSYSNWMDNLASQVSKLGGVVVVMLRNPISHLSSLKKAPYNLGGCLRSAFYDVGGTCSFDPMINPYGVPPYQFQAPGPMGVWNDYSANYLEYAKRHPNVVLVRYEDLVLNPDDVVQRIGAALQLQAPNPARIVGGPAKNHGAPVGRAAAILKIQQRSYLDLWGIRSYLPKICAAFGASQREWDLRIPVAKPPNGAGYFSDCSITTNATGR